MQARFPGTCRDCGNKFPAGTDIHYDRRTKKASCCNGSPKGTMFPATQEQATAWQEYFGKGGDSLASNPSQADRAFIVDGAMKMEWVEEKTYQEGVAFQGDSVIYEERVYSGYNWMCFECKLVWDKQHQAKKCKSRGHVTTYEDTYGVREVENGVPKGNNMYTITRTAIRREKSPHNPGCDGSGSHANGCTFGNYESTSSHQPGCDGSGSHKDGCTNGPAPKRGPAMTYMPDAIAETMKGVSKDLYAALWEIAAKLPYERLYPGEVGTQELTERQLTGRMKKNGASAETIANLKEVLRKSEEELDSWMNESAPQADPQDMTSEQLWESMGPGTITTSWN